MNTTRTINLADLQTCQSREVAADSLKTKTRQLFSSFHFFTGPCSLFTFHFSLFHFFTRSLFTVHFSLFTFSLFTAFVIQITVSTKSPFFVSNRMKRGGLTVFFCACGWIYAAAPSATVKRA